MFFHLLHLFLILFLVQVLVCGAGDYKAADLQAAVKSNVPEPQSQWLWSIVEDMTPEERSMFLLFITGSSTVPAGGFTSLSRSIVIAAASMGADSLPVSHTCFNTLEMPLYPTRDVMREKLLFAIRNCGATDFGMA